MSSVVSKDKKKKSRKNLTHSHRVSHIPRLYFLHIPKTAGTSFRLWLSRYFHAEKTLMIDHLAELEATSDETLLEHDFYSGHFGWRMVERAAAAGIDCEVVTVLREPLATFLSGFRYSTQIEDDDLSRIGEARENISNFIDMINKSDNQIELNEISNAGKDAFLDNMFTRYISRNGTEQLDASELNINNIDISKDRIKNISFLGIINDWSEIGILFAYRFCLPLKRIENIFNVTNIKTDNINVKQFEDILKRDSHYDFELYDFSQNLFSERIKLVEKELGLDEDAPIEAFEAPLLERFLKTEQGIPKLSKASIPITEGFIQSGFDHRYAYKDGWIIWSNKLTSSIYLPLNATRDISVRFIVGIMMNQLIMDGLKISVGGKEREIQREYFQSPQEPETWHIHLTIQVAAGSIPDQQYVDIAFHSPELVRVDDGDFKDDIAFALVGDILISEI